MHKIKYNQSYNSMLFYRRHPAPKYFSHGLAMLVNNFAIGPLFSSLDVKTISFQIRWLGITIFVVIYLLSSKHRIGIFK